ncbi:MAG: ORF6N domain-containing protein [Solibacillus sp.]|uniref:ORF6N domain-containing protein n=1 Tax=Solibacillus sp. TaxID=1909654 RepID=UPI0033164000
MELAQINYFSQQVLTTAQIAETYQVDSKALMRNFQRHKEKFQEGVHYYALTGEELKQFKAGRQNDVSLKFVSVLYLWTEQGALVLAKSLSSNKAWTAYQLLTSQYFKLSKQSVPQLSYDPEKFLALENRVKEIELQLQLVTLHSGEQKRLQKAISERVYELCGVKARRPSYFSDLYRAIKKRYHVDSYRDVPQCQLQDALQFVAHYGGGVNAS